ncbi:hypothetical protein DL769_003042 [Monosporascus sp. CRB-8-3]|nr:hypothetical protein DL769_003042 [Monosporascus sp. CRB-8-3]
MPKSCTVLRVSNATAFLRCVRQPTDVTSTMRTSPPGEPAACSMTNIYIKEFNDDKSVFPIGPRTRWIDVYNFTSLYGLAVAGDRYGQVGVGGLSYWRRRQLLGALDGAQVVLGNGSIVESSATSHPDLFWALKGGNNNYGIVTRFDMKTYPVITAYAGATAWDGEDAAQVVADAIRALSWRGLVSTIPTPGSTPASRSTRLRMRVSPVPLTSPFVNGDLLGVSAAHREPYKHPRLRPEQFRALTLKVAPRVVDLAVDVVLRPALEEGELTQVDGSVVSVAFEPISQMMLQDAQDSGDYAMDLGPAGDSVTRAYPLLSPEISAHSPRTLTLRSKRSAEMSDSWSRSG